MQLRRLLRNKRLNVVLRASAFSSAALEVWFIDYSEGVAPQSPRLLYSATLGNGSGDAPNPNGVAAVLHVEPGPEAWTERTRNQRPAQPLRGWDTQRRFPQGSRGRQPWAERAYPLRGSIQ